ncbi:MAG: hypothetical protein Q8M94_14960, partial [Ignavibacteria bacterium]|nr:hypothetical protein [Ignavibacteria bacterium]
LGKAMNRIGYILSKYKYVCCECGIGKEISARECYGWLIDGKNACELKNAEEEIRKAYKKEVK